MEGVATQSTLLKDAAIVNSHLISLPRIQLLGVLEIFGRDGIAFRELQAQMGMTDGKLLSNLYAMRDMGVIEEEKAKVENKKLTAYRMTDMGREEWERARSWLLQWLGLR